MASRPDGNKHEEKRELTPMRNALSVDLSAVVVDLHEQLANPPARIKTLAA